MRFGKNVLSQIIICLVITQPLTVETLSVAAVTVLPGSGPDPGGWQFVGPSSIKDCPLPGGITVCSGRVTAIAVDPGQPSRIYVGGALGGVWKSTDAGLDWTSLTDDQPSLAVGSIAVDPSGSLYVGTGEGNRGCTAYYGAGLLKSMDGGNTWVQLGASTFGRSSLNKIVVSPDSPNIVMASTSQGFSNSPTFSCGLVDPLVPFGLYVSLDAGNSWRLAMPSSRGTAGDIAVDPFNTSQVYAAVEGTVYLSRDKGVSWEALSTGLPPPNSVGRVALSVSASSSGTLYAALQDLSLPFPGQGRLFRTSDGGSSWMEVPTPAPTNFCGAFNGCAYNLVLAIDPTDADTVYLGGNDLFRTTDGGNNWVDLGGYGNPVLHPDQHALAFSPEDHTRVYVGNDGGMYYSAEANTCLPASCWTDLNSGLGITQFYSVAAHPTDPNLFFGGTQDNGITLRLGNSLEWRQALGGDAGFTGFDPVEPSTMYAAFTIPLRSDDGGLSWTTKTNGLCVAPCNALDSSQPFVPMAIDHASPGTLYLGSYRLWKTTDRGDNWFLPSPGLSLPGANCAPASSDCISAIAVAPSGGRVVYVGTKLGKLFVSTDGGSNFSERDTLLPGHFLTKIAINPQDPQKAFATFSGFGGGHIFATSNAGISWADISGGLPDFPANAVAVGSRGTVYVGTDQGVFVQQKRSGGIGLVNAIGQARRVSWSILGRGLPKTAVYDLTLAADGALLAATFGRGIWRINLPRIDVGTGSAASTPPIIHSVSSSFLYAINSSPSAPLALKPSGPATDVPYHDRAPYLSRLAHPRTRM